MSISRSSGRITGTVAAMTVFVIVAAYTLDASANDATMQINNNSGMTLTLKEKRVSDPTHARITMAMDTIPPGFNGAFVTGNSDWPYTIDPDVIYLIGDTGKTIRLQALQGSPIPTIYPNCEFPNGAPPNLRCVTSEAFGVNYTVNFSVGR